MDRAFCHHLVHISGQVFGFSRHYVVTTSGNFLWRLRHNTVNFPVGREFAEETGPIRTAPLSQFKKIARRVVPANGPAAIPRSAQSLNVAVRISPDQNARFDIALALHRGNIRCLRAQPIEHEQPDCRREIALLTRPVDFGDHIRQRHVLPVGDVFQAAPEGIFETDAGLVSTEYDRSLDDWRLHESILLQGNAPKIRLSRFRPQPLTGYMQK